MTTARELRERALAEGRAHPIEKIACVDCGVTTIRRNGNDLCLDCFVNRYPLSKGCWAND